MFAVRRILRNTKQLSNHICTSSLLKCDETSKKQPDGLNAEKVKKAKKVKEREDQVEAGKGKKAEEVKKNVEHESVNRQDILADLRPPQKSKAVLRPKTQLQKDLFTTAEEVAGEIGGDTEKTKRDLMDYIKTLEVTREKSDLTDPADTYFLSPIRKRDRFVQKGDRIYSKGFPFSKKGLKVFKKDIMETEDKVKLKIWNSLEAENLAFLSKTPPRNYFDELIQWTNEGKLWKFPIDNEQGMDDEAANSFTEHIFLEKHLKPWCPERGPIKKFMDMVLIGLSKNPYISVEDKKAHIMWFRDYFETKRKLLQELGAMGPAKIDASDEDRKS